MTRFQKIKNHTVSITFMSRITLVKLMIKTITPHATATLESKVLWAANEGKIDVARTILNIKPDCVHAKDEDGYTPLHRACYNNNIELAKLLIQHGADVNALTDFKWTPLHSSCQWSNNKCVAMLLQYGADVNARTDGGGCIMSDWQSVFFLSMNQILSV